MAVIVGIVWARIILFAIIDVMQNLEKIMDERVRIIVNSAEKDDEGESKGLMNKGNLTNFDPLRELCYIFG